LGGGGGFRFRKGARGGGKAVTRRDGPKEKAFNGLFGRGIRYGFEPFGGDGFACQKEREGHEKKGKRNARRNSSITIGQMESSDCGRGRGGRKPRPTRKGACRATRGRPSKGTGGHSGQKLSPEGKRGKYPLNSESRSSQKIERRTVFIFQYRGNIWVGESTKEKTTQNRRTGWESERLPSGK